MTRPKITITKLFKLNDKGHYRYYSTNYDPSTKEKVRSITYNLEPNNEYDANGNIYPYLHISKEKELAMFLLQTFGPGEYRVIAHLKGRKGSYTFWKGMVNEEGYQFYTKNQDRSEINKLKREMQDAENLGDDEEIQQIKEDIDFIREQNAEDSKKVRYGFYPYLKRSGKRGDFHTWDEPEIDDYFEESQGPAQTYRY